MKMMLGSRPMRRGRAAEGGWWRAADMDVSGVAKNRAQTCGREGRAGVIVTRRRAASPRRQQASLTK
ncbi:hypothetical protein PSAC2689_30003 [Paraburkholderia sacchari]